MKKLFVLALFRGEELMSALKIVTIILQLYCFINVLMGEEFED